MMKSSLVADKWAILYALSQGTLRHGQLHRLIGGISQKMLTKTLRNLERDGLIYRVVPLKVEYSLTPMGADLMGPQSPRHPASTSAGWSADPKGVAGRSSR